MEKSSSKTRDLVEIIDVPAEGKPNDIDESVVPLTVESQKAQLEVNDQPNNLKHTIFARNSAGESGDDNSDHGRNVSEPNFEEDNIPSIFDPSGSDESIESASYSQQFQNLKSNARKRKQRPILPRAAKRARMTSPRAAKDDLDIIVSEANNRGFAAKLTKPPKRGGRKRKAFVVDLNEEEPCEACGGIRAPSKIDTSKRSKSAKK